MKAIITLYVCFIRIANSEEYKKKILTSNNKIIQEKICQKMY